LNIKPSHERRIDILIWVCIYGGLLSIIGGLALSDASPAWVWPLAVGGSLVTAMGVVLIYIRSNKN
jgi:hypothetical protein